MSSGCLSWVRRPGLALCALALSLSAKPQTPADATAPTATQLYTWLLNSAGADTLVVADDDLPPSFEPGWLEQVELRTETDQFAAGRQRFAARARPKLPHVRRAERALQEAQRAALRAGDPGEAQELLAGGLLVLAEAVADVRERIALDSLLAVQRRLLEVTRQRIMEPDFDVERVLDAEDELDDLRLRADQLDARLLRRSLPVGADALATLPQLSTRLGELAAEPVDLLRTYAEDLAVIDAEMKLERAENLMLLDFLQLEYRSGREVFNEQLSVGASIRLPRNPARIRALDELQLERLEEERDRERRTERTRRQRDDDIAAVRELLEVHAARVVAVRARRERRERLAAVLRQSDQTRPGELLKLRRRSLRDRLALAQLEEDIREAYHALIGEYVPLTEASLTRWVLR